MKKGLRLLGLLLLLVGVNGCRGHLPEAPKVTICAHSIESKGFNCIHADDTAFFLPYDKAPNYIATSVKDAEATDRYILGLERELTQCRSP